MGLSHLMVTGLKVTDSNCRSKIFTLLNPFFLDKFCSSLALRTISTNNRFFFDSKCTIYNLFEEILFKFGSSFLFGAQRSTEHMVQKFFFCLKCST